MNSKTLMKLSLMGLLAFSFAATEVYAQDEDDATEEVAPKKKKAKKSKKGSPATRMIVAIEKEFYVKILPLKKEHMQTYAHMEINEAQGHKDPSDHVIIAHAITEHLPLISSDTRFGFYRSQGLDLVFNQK